MNRFCLLFIFAVLTISCTVSCNMHSLSPRAEIEASLATTQWLQQRYGFVADSQCVSLLLRVTKRLSSSLSESALDPLLDRDTVERFGGNYPWQVFVLDTAEPNAFSAGAGLIFVTRGLFRSTASEAELASVIAHEMAHELLGHTRQALHASDLRQDRIDSPDGPRFQFTLEHELAADTLAIHLLKVARYDLRDSARALSIVYRPLENIVSLQDPARPAATANWLEMRLSNIDSEIKEAGSFLPATHNTREYNHVRKLM